MSLASSGGASGTSTSLDSFKDAQLTVDDGAVSASGGPTFVGDHTYDLPPTYEEALSEAEALQSPPHRYYEIDELLQHNNEHPSPGSADRAGTDQAESPIYADIDEVLSPKEKEKEEPKPSENPVIYILQTIRLPTKIEKSIQPTFLLHRCTKWNTPFRGGRHWS